MNESCLKNTILCCEPVMNELGEKNELFGFKESTSGVCECIRALVFHYPFPTHSQGTSINQYTGVFNKIENSEIEYFENFIAAFKAEKQQNNF